MVAVLTYLTVSVLAIGALASPLTDPCAVVKCTSASTCKVIDGKAVCVPRFGLPCGPNRCTDGETCCNASCGICTKPGGGCVKKLCATGPKCGPALCPIGETCCNESCGICAKPGGACPMIGCLPPPVPLPEPTGPKCGNTTCSSGDVCCNASCGICTPPGGACITLFCGPVEPPVQPPIDPPLDPNVPCGPTVCSAGNVCCNASCGYCTKPGGACTQELCGAAPPISLIQPSPTAPAVNDDASPSVEDSSEAAVAAVPAKDVSSLWGEKCGTNTCAKGFVCCNASCGVCTPPGWMCTQQVCEPLEAPQPTLLPGLPKCGKTFCKAGQVCCNASCGTCTKPGGKCTQQICPSLD